MYGRLPGSCEDMQVEPRPQTPARQRHQSYCGLLMVRIIPYFILIFPSVSIPFSYAQCCLKTTENLRVTL